MPDTGPRANLSPRARRSGRAGKVFIRGKFEGTVVAVTWTTEIEQVAVPIPGAWKTGTKPGGETRTGTFRYQDVDDHFALITWRFLDARRRGDRSAAAFPEFSIVTVLDDIGAPRPSRWQLDGCNLYQLDGGHEQETDLLVRDTPFSYDNERPVDAFEYTDSGIATTRA